MIELPYLSLIIIFPLLGAILVGLCGHKSIAYGVPYSLALLFSLLVFLTVGFLYFQYDAGAGSFQFAEKHAWLLDNINYHVAIDGVSLLFLLFISFLFILIILSVVHKVKEYGKAFLVYLLILESALLGVFVSLDGLLFYLFFELSLIPMFFLIGIWGKEGASRASFKFFLYTLFGSVLMLASLLALYSSHHTLDLIELAKHPLASKYYIYIWFGFFIAFAIKLPIWPVHSWIHNVQLKSSLPAMLLVAAILFLLGGYGFYRFIIGVLVTPNKLIITLLMILLLVGLFYNFAAAFVSSNFKKIMTFSLIAHMSYILLALLSASTGSVTAALFQMVAHGFIAFGIFFLIGVLEERANGLALNEMGGVVAQMPIYSIVLMILIVANVGLPGTIGFVGELLILFNLYLVNNWVAIIAVLSVIFSAAYSLRFYRAVAFDKLNANDHNSANLVDLTAREKTIIFPIIFIVLFFGFYPQPIINLITPSVEHFMDLKNDPQLTHIEKLSVSDIHVLADQQNK